MRFLVIKSIVLGALLAWSTCSFSQIRLFQLEKAATAGQVPYSDVSGTLKYALIDTLVDFPVDQGISKNGDTVVLGGVITDPTLLYLDSTQFEIAGYSNLANYWQSLRFNPAAEEILLKVGEGLLDYKTSLWVNYGQVRMRSISDSSLVSMRDGIVETLPAEVRLKVDIGNTGTDYREFYMFEDSTYYRDDDNGKFMSYYADYSASANPRSIPDVGYVQDMIDNSLSSIGGAADSVLAEVSALDTGEVFTILPVNCSGAARTVRPPVSPSVGDWFAVSDSRAASANNNITIDFTTSSTKLHAVVQNYIMNVNADFVRFTWTGATIGWIKTN